MHNTALKRALWIFSLITLCCAAPSLELVPSAPPKTSPDTTNSSNEKPVPAGKNGVSMPDCSKMANAPFTKEAKAAKFHGVVVVVATVELDGRITHINIVKS